MERKVSAPNWLAEDGHHIDVRGLGPPEPMVQILILLGNITESAGKSIGGRDVIAHLDREPVYLYPELLELGWNYKILSGEEGEVRMRLWMD